MISQRYYPQKRDSIWLAVGQTVGLYCFAKLLVLKHSLLRNRQTAFDYTMVYGKTRILSRREGEQLVGSRSDGWLLLLLQNFLVLKHSLLRNRQTVFDYAMVYDNEKILSRKRDSIWLAVGQTAGLYCFAKLLVLKHSLLRNRQTVFDYTMVYG